MSTVWNGDDMEGRNIALKLMYNGTAYHGWQVQKTQIRKGSYLTQYGVINNTAYYIKNGIVHLSLGHEQGKKSLNMFGPGLFSR